MIFVESEKERSVLEQFKDKLREKSEEIPDDVTSLRFIRAREHNTDKALTMYRNTCKWRKENNIQIYLNYIPPQILADHGLRFKMTGHDYDGRPVIWAPMGKYNVKDLIEAGYKEDTMKFIYHFLESNVNYIAQSSTSQCINVLAMEDLGMKQLLHLETMRVCYSGFQQMEQNYPEILKHIIVVNAPWIFSIGFNFIKPIISRNTFTKLQIFQSDKTKWIPELLKIMPKSAIPVEYLGV